MLHGNVKFPANLSVVVPLVRAAIPFGIGAGLVFLAVAIWGVRKGLQLRVLGIRRAVNGAVTVTILRGLAYWTDGWYATARPTWSGGVCGGAAWQARLLPIPLLDWPLVYMIATSICQRRRSVVSAESV